jgi:hypothetical protein
MKKIVCTVFAAFCAVGAFAEPLKIGWGMTDVSTDKPVELYGIPRRRVSQGLRDPLKITTLVIDNGQDCVIFSTWDVCVVWGTLVQRVRAIVRDKCPEIPVDKIIFHAIHTHTGPALGDGYDDDVTREYRSMFVKRAAESVIMAWKNRKPGKIGYGYDFAVTSFSRRPVYLDDLSKRPPANPNLVYPPTFSGVYSKLHGNSFDKMFSHMEAAPDPFVNFLFTYDLDDKLTGVVFNVAFPSQISISDMKLGSDCWSDIRRVMAKEYPGVHVLPQCAAAGDLTFKIPYYYKATSRKHKLLFGREEKFPGEFERQRCTEQMMAALRRTLPWAGKELFGDLPIKHINTTIHLKRFAPSEKDIAEAKANLEKLKVMWENRKTLFKNDPERLKKGVAMIRRENWRNTMVLRSAEELKTEKTWPSEFHVLHIGDVAFVSERYELYTDYGQRIQARSPFTQTFTIQICAQMYYHTGSAAHYLATERAFRHKGYQASPENNWNAPSPEGGQQMVDLAVKMLYELKGEPEPQAPTVAK